MATTSFDSIWSVGATRVIVPVGPTLAVFMKPQADQQGWVLNFLSGSAEILSTGIGSSNLNLNFGTTLAGGSLVAYSGSGYPLSSSNPPLEIRGPAMFYLSSLGATSIIACLQLKGQGY